MDIGHVTLDRPWLYDLDVTIFKRSNYCPFTFLSKKIQLFGLPPKFNDNSKNKKKVKEIGLNIISSKEFDKEVCKEFVMFTLVTKKVILNSLKEPPEKVRKVLKEFLDVFPSKLPDVLPYILDIQHAIYFVLGATLPNLPHYKMNPSEHAKLQRQIYELLQIWFI
jgi:hypothetical protein